MSAHAHPTADRRQAPRPADADPPRRLRRRRARHGVPLRRGRRGGLEHDRRLHLGHLGARERRRLHRHRRRRLRRRPPHLPAQQGPSTTGSSGRRCSWAPSATRSAAAPSSSPSAATGTPSSCPVVPWWNLASVLLEVAICVMAYVFVLWIEVAPGHPRRRGREPLAALGRRRAALGPAARAAHALRHRARHPAAHHAPELARRPHAARRDEGPPALAHRAPAHALPRLLPLHGLRRGGRRSSPS